MHAGVEGVALGCAVALAAMHLFAGRLRFLDKIPRSRWLSVAAGISVAYVVVHLLPEIAEYQERVNETVAEPLAVLERHLYVLALVGLAVFYGVERWSRASRRRGARHDVDLATLFSIASYGLYNAVVGYLLVRREGGLLLFATAMGLHFVVNDHGLRQDHGDAYHRYGRWLISASVVVGALVAVTGEVAEPVVGVLLAFIGGGTILNVLKEELPEERESRFSAFLTGAGVYTAVLLAV